jgi:hypothetical protein
VPLACPGSSSWLGTGRQKRTIFTEESFLAVSLPSLLSFSLVMVVPRLGIHSGGTATRNI